MDRSEVLELEPGDIVVPKIGKYAGMQCEVTHVELNSGAYHGWITVKLPDGVAGLYVGEEIDFSHRPSPAQGPTERPAPLPASSEGVPIIHWFPIPFFPFLFIFVGLFLMWYFGRNP